MRPRLVAPLVSMLLFCATGCDLVSDPEGPRPEDFEVQEETSEVRANDEGNVAAAVVEVQASKDVAVPLSTARGGITRSFEAVR